jgi:hypothetical protein
MHDKRLHIFSMYERDGAAAPASAFKRIKIKRK